VTREELLTMALSAAVPLKIADLADYSPDARARLAVGCADAIAAHGDDLQYGGADCVPAFAALARGLAVGAYQPGGITFAGTHWCAAGCDCPAAHTQGRAIHTGQCGCGEAA
jgi:hypothetical protein